MQRGAGRPSGGRVGDDRSDLELARAAATGDQAAFETLARRHRRLLDAACATACPDRTEREDALQVALVDVWRGLAGFKGDAKVSTWMYRVAQNAARRHGQRTRRGVPVVDSADEPVEVGSPAAEWNDALDTRSAIIDALWSLPEDHREALLLHTQGGLSMQEIAEVKFAAVGTVKSWIHRARTEVARALDDAER